MSAIQSIEVLKDAASTAIYGSRGANGIIMITTKSGKTSKPNVALSATFSLQQRYDKLELVDAYDMAQYMLEARNTGYVNKNPSIRKETDDTAVRKANGASKRELIPDYLYPYLNGEKGLTNTNWLDEVFQLAPMQDYNISVSGGSEKAFYSLSAGYMKQEGIVVGTDFDKFSANVNLKLMPTNTITLGFSFSPSYSKKNTFDEDALSSNFLNIATGIYPFLLRTMKMEHCQYQSRLRQIPVRMEHYMRILLPFLKRCNVKQIGSDFLAICMLKSGCSKISSSKQM